MYALANIVYLRCRKQILQPGFIALITFIFFSPMDARDFKFKLCHISISIVFINQQERNYHVLEEVAAARRIGRAG